LRIINGIIILSEFDEVLKMEFWMFDFGWIPTVVDLVRVRPKNIYCISKIQLSSYSGK
jgi:hypothetical protein